MTARIIRGNALDLPLGDNSVDLICTSPPYFGLRSYQDGGEHYAGQLGSEPTPADFVAALVAATREMVRVLKPSGSIFVNLGDKYAGKGGGAQGASSQRAGRSNVVEQIKPGRLGGPIPDKSLMLIPERYRIACVDDLGLIARAVIVWDKPNGLPESVRDRVRRSHEDWVHFTKMPRYYSAVDEVREECVRSMRPNDMRQDGAGIGGGAPEHARRTPVSFNPLGKLPGSVWRIATQPLIVPASLGIDHFAAYPMEFPRRIIKGWSPREVCTACGQGRAPVVDRSEKVLHRPGGAAHVGTGMADRGPGGNIRSDVGNVRTVHTLTGYACACPDTTAPTTPGVVLDPFGGTGTTALVASVLGRQGISVDMSADYCRLATWRTTDRGQIASAMQVEKPEPVDEAQYGLFGVAS